MIIVDSSVWIDYFNGVPTRQVEALDSMLPSGDVVVGDLVMAEVLQGFRDERTFAQGLDLLSRFELIELAGRENAIRAAQHYRTLRTLGITVRKTIDTLIASACIERGGELLYSDRDFDAFVTHLELKTALTPAVS